MKIVFIMATGVLGLLSMGVSGCQAKFAVYEVEIKSCEAKTIEHPDTFKFEDWTFSKMKDVREDEQCKDAVIYDTKIVKGELKEMFDGVEADRFYFKFNNIGGCKAYFAFAFDSKGSEPMLTNRKKAVSVAVRAFLKDYSHGDPKLKTIVDSRDEFKEWCQK